MSEENKELEFFRKLKELCEQHLCIIEINENTLNSIQFNFTTANGGFYNARSFSRFTDYVHKQIGIYTT